jgi:hypothetical protein
VFLKFGNMSRDFANRPRLIAAIKIGRIMLTFGEPKKDVDVLVRTKMFNAKSSKSSWGGSRHPNVGYLSRSGKKLKYNLNKIEKTMNIVISNGIFI